MITEYLPDDAHLMSCGYSEPVRRFDTGRIACIMEINPWLFAIVTDLFPGGHSNAFYYPSRATATAALLEWNGDGEPAGWWRHPQTGRRRRDGDPQQEIFQP